MRFVQRLDAYRVQQSTGTWRQLDPRAPGDVQCGVMGLGVIGSAIARALVNEGFAVRGYARGVKSVEGVRCFAGDLGTFLAGLDFLVSVLPATKLTTGLLDRRALERLADGAHVVNIGRGNLLVDDDLLALIDEGKLAGATLDVFREEPLPPQHPFWRHPRITLTPHVSAVTQVGDSIAQVAAKIRRLERGEAVTGVVDRARGY